jgi:hypothetical protein
MPELLRADAAITQGLEQSVRSRTSLAPRKPAEVVFAMGWESQWRSGTAGCLPTEEKTHRLTLLHSWLDEQVLSKTSLQNYSGGASLCLKRI